MSDVVDQKYYEVIKPSSMSERLLIAARDEMFADFLRFAKPAPESMVLDVGVSDVISDAANALERKYQYRQNVTACGLGEASEFQKAFPDIRYHQILPNQPLPFLDDAFDIATANAVLEHVGSAQNQDQFLTELLRVAKSVFITVPNRFFPIEQHTAIPMLHYTDSSFKLVCRWTGKQSWAEEQNLILMSWSRLRKLARAINYPYQIGHTGLKLGPFSSNLFLLISRR
ncbi:methyltransferase domain-containing protein [uncultured Bradyrhizobium sp.]|jgi:SAM-dependent methyltransferase|uniref:methyltransferase domain-containing protein n=1 Tax=uncultured Bradyrhizobium sp. TaxID=199684 RepID=UPI0026318617|nr:methyltransferase domain-containing protein [uncultured Bradyrhizobium sp.]